MVSRTISHYAALPLCLLAIPSAFYIVLFAAGFSMQVCTVLVCQGDCISLTPSYGVLTNAFEQASGVCMVPMLAYIPMLLLCLSYQPVILQEAREAYGGRGWVAQETPDTQFYHV
jgi:hypothetical protein